MNKNAQSCFVFWVGQQPSLVSLHVTREEKRVTFSLFGHLIDRRGRPCDRITLFTHAQLFSAMPASKCFSFLSCFSYEYILCEWNQAKIAFGNARFRQIAPCLFQIFLI